MNEAVSTSSAFVCIAGAPSSVEVYCLWTLLLDSKIYKLMYCQGYPNMSQYNGTEKLHPGREETGEKESESRIKTKTHVASLSQPGRHIDDDILFPWSQTFS